MGRATEITRQIRWYWASLMGDNHYRRYVEHRGRTHPGEPVCTEREVLADAPRRHRREPAAPAAAEGRVIAGTSSAAILTPRVNR